MSRTFNLDENIFEMEYYTGETLELNKGNWGDDKSEYDFRLWLDDLPSSGFSMSKDDLHSIYLKLKRYFDEDDLEYNYAYKDFDDVLLVNEEKISIMLQGITETEEGIEIHLLYTNGTDDDWGMNVTDIYVDNDLLDDDYGPSIIEVTNMEADSGIKKISFELEGLSLKDEHNIEFVFWISDEPYELFTSSPIRIIIDAENEELIVELEDNEEETEESDDEADEIEEEIIEFKSFLVYTDNPKCQ